MIAKLCPSKTMTSMWTPLISQVTPTSCAYQDTDCQSPFSDLQT